MLSLCHDGLSIVFRCQGMYTRLSEDDNPVKDTEIQAPIFVFALGGKHDDRRAENQRKEVNKQTRQPRPRLISSKSHIIIVPPVLLGSSRLFHKSCRKYLVLLEVTLGPCMLANHCMHA